MESLNDGAGAALFDISEVFLRSISVAENCWRRRN
jgi:hypothetical protein